MLILSGVRELNLDFFPFFFLGPKWNVSDKRLRVETK